MILAVVVLLSAWAVDSGAEGAFDAARRFFCCVGIALATLAQFGRSPTVPEAEGWSRQTGKQRAAVVLVTVAIVLGVISAVASPRPEIAAAAGRVILVFALLLPVAASSALDGGRVRWVGAALAAAVGLNALLALLEVAGWVQLFQLESVSGRNRAFGLVGNEGILAISVALAVPLAVPIVLRSRSTALRAGAGGLLALAGLTLLVTASATGVVAAFASLAVVGWTMLPGWRIRLGLLGGGALLLLTALAMLSSGRATIVLEGLRRGDWNPLLTYRLGPWLAATEMIRDRPILGFGPGPFGAEFVTHRLAAEARTHSRLGVAGSRQTSFGEAHDDYLQALAELGIPGALSAFAAAGMVLAGLFGVAARGTDGDREEAAVLLAVLVAGAVAAVAWFPFQTPTLAVPLLIAAGRGWRLLAREPA